MEHVELELLQTRFQGSFFVVQNRNILLQVPQGLGDDTKQLPHSVFMGPISK